VLSEADAFTPEQSVHLSDAIMRAVRRVSPDTRFVALSVWRGTPDLFECALNPGNRRPQRPIDMIAYHFYAYPAAELFKYESYSLSAVGVWQYTFFDQADAFIDKVRYVEAIRKRLSPSTRVNLNELGTYAPGDFDANATDTGIPQDYWSLSGAVFAYLYVELAKQGIDIVAQSLLAAGPGMAPGNTMLNWQTGQPNARYRVLKLLKDNFGAGDRMIATTIDQRLDVLNPDLAAQAFVTSKGKKILLINKRWRALQVDLSKAGTAVRLGAIDDQSEDRPPQGIEKIDGPVNLKPFATVVVSVE